HLIEEEQTHSALDPSHREFILEHVRDLIEEAETYSVSIKKKREEKQENSQRKSNGKDSPRPTTAPTRTTPRVLCVPAHDETDELAGLMLTILLKRKGTD